MDVLGRGLGVGLALALAALAGSGELRAQTGQAAVAATIEQGIYLQKTADLNFGDIAPGLVPGTVTVSPAGIRLSGGGANLVTNAGNPPAAAGYSVDLLTNKGTKKFWVQLPANGVVSISNGTSTMWVNDFSSSGPCATSGATPPGAAGGCDGAPASFNVGATLAVGASQPVGTYTGTFAVTVHRF